MSYDVKNFDEALKIYDSKAKDGRCKEDVKLSEELALELVNQMSYLEKAVMIRGHWSAVLDFFRSGGRIYNSYAIKGAGCKRLGIPPIMFSDGPRGVVVGHGTCFPTANVRAAAFDRNLEYEIGNAIARECIASNANYFAGICINLLRHPAWGRAQESYGEDQYMLGQMGVQLTKAVQEHGIIACPKHYAMNSMENLRFKIDVAADEETLRDVYLPHFKDCIDAGALSIMGSYNKYRGTYCCENDYLLKDILRGEWGFDGFATSDFIWGVRHGVMSLKNGMDVEMPLTYKRFGISLALRHDKEANAAAIESCKLITASLLRIQSLYREQKVDKNVKVCEAHTALARKALEEGAVLLKNNGVLPYKDAKQKFAVVGRYADKINIGDKGSSCVYPPYVVTLGKAMQNTYENVNLCSTKNIAKCEKAAADADTILVVVGFSNHEEGEFLVNLPGNQIGGDRPSLRLAKCDVDLIRAMKKLGKPVVVVYYAGSAAIIDEWSDEADAIVFAGYPGMEGGNALCNLLSGKVNFSGKLPFTIAHTEEDYPDFVYSGSHPSIEYGYYHGYALFEKKGIEPAYQFGYGLSYTTYEYSNLKAEKKEDGVHVLVDMKNTGEVDGRGIVQLYIGSNMENKPKKLLKGFADQFLKAGESKTMELFVPNDKLKLYNGAKKEYEMPEKITVYAGGSVADKDLIKVNL